MMITLDSEGAFVIRSTLKDKTHRYHESGIAWGRSPTRATIYRSEWSAKRFIADMRRFKRPGFGASAIVEAVTLAGALASVALPLELGPIDDEDV